MRAAVLTGLNRIEIQDVPDLKLTAADDVLLRIAAVGVCGSDVHYYTTGKIGSQVVQYPFVVGHECSAIVEAVGTDVRSLRPGDRVAVDPAVSCLACDQCLNGRPHTCRNIKFLGCPGQMSGCLSEFLVMPERCCIPLPKTASLEDGALIEPLAIGYYAVRQAALAPNVSIGILGMGPIGSSVMLAARAGGMKQVFVTDKIQARRRLALEHGADWAGNPDTDDIVAQINSLQPAQLDVVFECCGKQEALDQAVELLKPGGKLMVVGIPEFDRYSFSNEHGRRKELCFQHVRRQNGCVHDTVNAVAAETMKPGYMVTHRLPLTAVSDAFELVTNYRDGVLKALIMFDQA